MSVKSKFLSRGRMDELSPRACFCMPWPHFSLNSPEPENFSAVLGGHESLLGVRRASER